MPRDPWDERRRESPSAARPSANGNGRRPGEPTPRDRSGRDRGGQPPRGEGLDRGALPRRNGGGAGRGGAEPRRAQPGGRRPAGGPATPDGFGAGRGDTGWDGRLPGAAAAGRDADDARRRSAGRDARDSRGGRQGGRGNRDPFADQPSDARGAGRGAPRRGDPAGGDRGRGDPARGRAADPRRGRPGGPPGNGGAADGWDAPSGDPWAAPGTSATAATSATFGVGPSGDRRQVRIGDPHADPRSAAGRDGRRDGPRHARRGDGDDEDGADGGPRRKRSWPQRVILGAGLVLVLFCMLGASVAGYALVKYNSIDRVDNLDLPSAAKGEPENFLIVAPDIREGHTSFNTDTIMVLRIDPKSEALALTSFPRDLIVTVADTGDTGMINAAYNRPDGTGPQNLINTLQQNYGVTIHHFVEVRFESFRQVVDAVGGVSMWFETAARDNGSGFYNEDLGCVTLDGERGLEFVRSRKLEIMTDDGWEHDPLSDVNRVQRQQIFIQRAMTKALADVKSNPLRLQQLIDIGVSNITLDPNLGLGDIVDLGEQFKDFDPAALETLPLPTLPWPQDENRLILDQANAEPMLNVFRGLPPGEIGPGLVDVQVLNGTHADPAQEINNLASDASSALQQVGFDVGAPEDAETFYAQTTIQHAPGQELYAQRVARHITSPTAIPTEVNTALSPGQVVVIAGADFTTVHDQPTPIEAMPVPPGQAPVETTVPADDTTSTTVAETPATTPTTQNPFIIGAAPENATC